MKLAAADLRALKGSICAAVLMIGGGLATVHYALAAAHAGERARLAAQAQRDDIDGKLRRVRSEEHESRRLAEVFREMETAGVVGDEQRLEWVELVKQIGEARRLPRLRYELAAQRPLDPPAQDGYAFHASAMKLEAELLHEEDLTRLMGDLRAGAKGLIVLRSCALTRLAAGDASSPARLRADCEIDWVSLRKVAGPKEQR